MGFGFDYEHLINRVNPAYIVILVDQSQAMGAPLGGETQASMAETLAAAVNRVLQELVIKSSKDISVMRLFGVSVIGYGGHAGPALGGELGSKPFVWVDELYAHPMRLDQVTKKVSDGAGGIIDIVMNMPIWLDPIARGRASMSQAFTLALLLAEWWVHTYPNAFFPLVLHLCGSVSADGDPAPWAKRIEQLGTAAGKCVVANAYLTPRRTRSAVYTDTDREINEPWAKRLYWMSSRLPDVLRERAGWFGYSLTDESRAFAINAGILDLIDFLPMDSC
ncbi:MAG: hypothetical protein U0X20_00455 [Caldilineaceae bacterium]